MNRSADVSPVVSGSCALFPDAAREVLLSVQHDLDRQSQRRLNAVTGRPIPPAPQAVSAAAVLAPSRPVQQGAATPASAVSPVRKADVRTSGSTE